MTDRNTLEAHVAQWAKTLSAEGRNLSLHLADCCHDQWLVANPGLTDQQIDADIEAISDICEKLTQPTRKLLRSVDGRQLPALGEVAVYWPHQDYTDLYSTAGFTFDDEPNISGERNGDEYPELIEHDAEATAKWLLAQMVAITQFPIGYMYEEVRNAARNAVTKVTGEQS